MSMEFETITLRQEQVESSLVVPSDEWVAAHNPRLHVEKRVDELVLKLRAFVFSDQDVTVSWSVYQPASWWQYFKADVLVPLTRNPSTRLGRWLREWAIPQLERESFRRTIRTKTCPHLEIPPTFGGEDVHIKWLTSQS